MTNYIINLAYPEKSHLKYEVSNFPDGQQNIKLVVEPGASMENSGAWIVSRFNSFKDLELIICITKDLRKLGCKSIKLHIPYILGARSDRKFEEGGNSYLVDVVAPILNAQGFDEVACFDPHSDVAAACINNLTITKQFGLFWYSNIKRNSFILVSPDAGAAKKIYDFAKAIDYTGPIVEARKHRDVITGNITHTTVPLDGVDVGDKDILIVDDICDGGHTFIEMAKEIRKTHKNPIKLMVSHGIFSAGFGELQQYFETIYTTNSVKDFDMEPFVKQYNII